MLTSRFEEALIFAFSLHKNQNRKVVPVPYFAHLMGVTSLVLESGGDEDTAVAALLHDAVEDQGGVSILNAIRDRFGVRVAEIVDACSDTYLSPKPPWRERKERYLIHLKNSASDARLVSLADKLYNVRTMIDALRLEGDKIWDRFNGGKDGTLWYYRALLDVFVETGSDLLTDKYAQSVILLEKLAAGEREKA